MSLSALPEDLLKQPSSLEPQGFDYSSLDTETRIVVTQRTIEIKERLRSAAQTAWGIGEKLVEVKERLGYGYFVLWLRAEFEWSERTAYNYISVFESFGTFATFAKLETAAAASALYLLAAPSTPIDARVEALKLVDGGKSITYKQAKTIVTRHKEALKSKKSLPVTVDASAQVNYQPFTLPLTKEVKPAQDTQPNRESLDKPSGVAEGDGREWVRIYTDRSNLRQWNDQVGVVVARPRGSVYVQIGNHTPSFLESEVQLIDIQLFPDDSQEPGLPHAPGKQEQLLGKESEKEPCQKNNLEVDSSTSPNSKDFLETEDEFLGNRTPLEASDSPDFTNQISAEQLNVGYTSIKEELHSTEADALSTALNSWGYIGSSTINNLVIKEVESERSASEEKSARSRLAEVGASKTELSPRSLVPEPKSQDKQLLPDVERNGDTPKDWKPPMPAVVINRAALAQGMPEVVVTELAIALLGLAPEQLARLLIFVSNGWGKSQINAVIEAWSCTELERISTELKHITLQVDREISRQNCWLAEKLEEKALAPEVEVQ